jgi:cytochrome c biogenesis protein
MSSPSQERLSAPPAKLTGALLELFSSMRFAISLLVILAIASIIGTVLTQEAPYPNYVDQFGPFWADIFRALGLYTVYSAWWFMLILIFLVISVSLCVIRNAPKMIADVRSWKDRVRESSLRAFSHKAEFAVQGAGARARAAQALGTLSTRAGYRHVVREAETSTLIAAKRGALTRFGYISTHLAIVVICLGGLLDSNLPISFESWLFHKTPITDPSAMIGNLGPEHRLSPSNPSFRGNAWVPEGQYVSTAILNRPNGVLVQDLPFSIRLDKFIVDYYSTGMPKLFASNIVVTDHATGKSTAARVEVNKPFVYDGIAIYQSSFQDGGSHMQMTAWPMTGAGGASFPVDGTVNGAAVPLPGTDGDRVEIDDFRAINVENLPQANGATDVRGVAHDSHSLSTMLDERLGSAAKSSKPLDLHNVGPSVRYKVRGKDGQAREFDNYMLPVELDGSRVFLAGVRSSEAEPFRYLRIPADQDDSVAEWMRIRAALQDPAVRAEAAQRFAVQALASGRADAALQGRLQDSAQRALDLFAGAMPASAATAGAAGVDPSAAGGFRAVAGFLDRAVPGADQQKAAGLFMRMLEGTMWEVWQVARERAHEAPVTQSADSVRFIEDTLNSLSDSFMYGAPVYLKLDSFQQVQASVFQLTRAPGRNLVYLGSLMLVAGIFAMFYVRERRLWFWLRETPDGARIAMAMSSARRTFDFERDFERMRAAAGAALGTAPLAAGETSPAADGSNSPQSEHADASPH